MIKLIAFLITGCWHRWKILTTINVFEHGHNNRPVATKYILQCEKCGSIKRTEV